MKQNQTIKEYIENHKEVNTQIYKSIYKHEHFVNEKLIKSYLYCEDDKTLIPRYLPKLTCEILNTKHFVEIMELAKETPIKNGDLYLAYYSGHILFDKDMNPVPTLQQFDYTGTPFHNGVLDLKKAIEVLKKHPWVKYVSDIEDIPSYNCDGESNQYIEVHILPDEKTFKELHEYYKNKEYWSVTVKDALHDFYVPDENHNFLGLYPNCVIKK